MQKMTLKELSPSLLHAFEFLVPSLFFPFVFTKANSGPLKQTSEIVALFLYIQLPNSVNITFSGVSFTFRRK